MREGIRGSAQVGIGGSCLPSYRVPAPVLHGSGILLDESDPDPDDENEIPGTDRCFYDNQIHEDLEQWPSPNDNCLMCSCQKGKVLCDKEICPLISCNNPIILPGQCCPICYGWFFLGFFFFPLQLGFEMGG